MTTVSASSKRDPASSGSIAKPANSLWRQPLPTPRSSRPPRQQVEGRGLLGQQHRIVPGQHQDRRAEAAAASCARRRRSTASAAPRAARSS